MERIDRCYFDKYGYCDHQEIWFDSVKSKIDFILAKNKDKRSNGFYDNLSDEAKDFLRKLLENSLVKIKVCPDCDKCEHLVLTIWEVPIKLAFISNLEGQKKESFINTLVESLLEFDPTINKQIIKNLVK